MDDLMVPSFIPQGEGGYRVFSRFTQEPPLPFGSKEGTRLMPSG